MERPSNLEKINSFSTLREETHEIIEREFVDRKKNNSKPTREELYVGAFREEIEPQVRDAVFEAYRKGYSTESSGFGGENGEIQQIDGYFEIDEEVKKKIEELGAKVDYWFRKDAPNSDIKYTRIYFYPNEIDLEKIKGMWQKIMELLPQKDEPVQPSINARCFIEDYAPDQIDIERLVLEKSLKSRDMHPDLKKEINDRIREIKFFDVKKR